jgi:hypothetical protein
VVNSQFPLQFHLPRIWCASSTVEPRTVSRKPVTLGHHPKPDYVVDATNQTLILDFKHSMAPFAR